MKRLITVIIATLLFITSFAHDGKNCGKEKKCAKEEMARCHTTSKKDCCKKPTKSALIQRNKATKGGSVSKKV